MTLPPVTSSVGEVGPQLSAPEIELRKRWLDFSEADEKTLAALHERVAPLAEEVVEDLFEHLLAFDEMQLLLAELDVLEYVKSTQRTYFRRLTAGDYGEDYVRDRVRVAAAHHQIGLGMHWYMGAYNRYLHAIRTRLPQMFTDDPELGVAAYAALGKLVFFDMGLAVDTFAAQSAVTIRLQQDAINELSTPVLQVREGLLILPIIGAIDSARAHQLTEQLLEAIRERRGRAVVLDITGVPVVDSHVANHLMQTIEAARLMGATAIVTGVAPGVAQALGTLGLDLTTLCTAGDLEGGIDEADRILGYRVVREADLEPSGSRPRED